MTELELLQQISDQLESIKITLNWLLGITSALFGASLRGLVRNE